MLGNITLSLLVYRWFAGDVSEAAVLPAYPAASLDRPSLEDVL